MRNFHSKNDQTERQKDTLKNVEICLGKPMVNMSTLQECINSILFQSKSHQVLCPLPLEFSKLVYMEE